MELRSLGLVTGASHRLGRAFATVLARNLYAVGVHYWTSEDQAHSTANELRALGAEVFVFRADLSDPASISALFLEIDNLQCPLRVLVNSAALFRAGDARRLSANDWDATLDLNLRAPFLCAKEAAARMTGGGLIVNITDVAARRHWSGFPAYSVSKAALEALTRVLARAYAPSIRVNAIAPGLILRSGETSDADWMQLIERLPLKRPGTTEEIAAAFEFLLKNEYVTGQTLVIDGGYSLLG
jgi:NAD(P)-dependent dehydrogenase (short-subunit alcohol dehydrogenase family)